MDQECAGPRNDSVVRDFTCDGAGHYTLNQRTHIDDDPRHIDQYRAVGLAEGFIEGTEEEVLAAWQYLVDTGLAWQLQGWFGRRAIELIEEGLIHR